MKLKGINRLVLLGILFIFMGSWYHTAVALASDSESVDKALTVSFNANGGKEVTEILTVTAGSAYGKLPTTTREHYKFLGWYTFPSAGSKISETDIVRKTQTLYAHWKGEECTITLKANGGILENNKVTVYYGSKYGNQLPIPVKENYTFSGWYTTAGAGDQVTAQSIFNKDSKKTLYAHWMKKSIKLVFIGFNGQKYEKQVNYGENYGILPVPEKEGYIFDGWYTLKDYSDTKAEPITENTVAGKSSALRLYARWIKASDEQTEK